MRTLALRIRPLLIVACLGALVSVEAARADYWYAHYEKAEKALEAEEWDRAVAEIQSALERKGDSGHRVRTYGMRVVDYLPYLKLGIAYTELGQPTAALEAFDTEERLGAVQQSPVAFAQLQEYRGLAVDQRRAANEALEQRRSAIVADGMAEARRLIVAGRTEEAVVALSAVLATDPENAPASELMTSLSRELAERDQAARVSAALAANLERAQFLLADGDFSAAASLLRQVLAESGENPRARHLLEQARQGLVEAASGARREEQVTNSLEAARRSQAAGDLREALAHLEGVFALEPKNAAGGAMARALTEELRRLEDERIVDGQIEEARRFLEAGEYELALSVANRTLAFDRYHREALEIVGDSYREISRRLLGRQGTEPNENLPPAIRFVDARQSTETDRVEILRQPTFRLRGVVIDRSPVRLEFLDDFGRTLSGVVDGQQLGDLVITDFGLRQDLAPGPTTVSIVATDELGLSSRSEYKVLYHPPWYLSPRWQTGIAMAIGLLVFGAWVRRRRRRRRRFQRRFNPYVAGRPVFDERLFFGREGLVQRVLQSVPHNSLLLFGERRIGKTSLLHQIERRLLQLEDPKYRFFPVYIDLQGTPEDAFFGTLADQIFEAASDWTGSFDREAARHRPGGYSHHELVRELRLLIGRLKEEQSRQIKLVLLIDEVDELNHYDPRVNQSLRSLFMKRFSQHLVAVVAGVGIRRAWDKEGSPWYNFFEEMEVLPIADEDARRLVREPMEGIFRCHRRAADRIVELSQGKPFLVQRLCLGLVQRMHEQNRRVISVEDVEALAAAAPRADSSAQVAVDRSATP